MKITKRQLRSLIREAIFRSEDIVDETDVEGPMAIINQALEDSIPAAAKISQSGHAETYQSNWRSGDSKTLSYRFMSTYAPHDDHTWNVSTQQSRQAVLDNLIKHGAVIEGPVPPMNDFGTPGVKFSLEGYPFELITTGHRYDVEIYAKG